MRRLLVTLAGAVLLGLGIGAAPAAASIGLNEFDPTFNDANGEVAMQAGSHPYALRVSFNANTKEVEGIVRADEAVKDLEITQVRGLGGILTAVPRCSTLDFLTPIFGSEATACADSSAIGFSFVKVREVTGLNIFKTPIYSLEPAPGKLAKIGFWVQGVPVSLDIELSEEAPYDVIVATHNVSQVLEFFSADTTIWGNPADPSHDEDRGKCYKDGEGPVSCPAGVPAVPFLTAPRACAGPLPFTWEVDSWENPGVTASGSTLTHDDSSPPHPRGFSGCGRLDFGPRIQTSSSSDRVSSPSGLEVGIDVADEGISNPQGIAASDIKKTVFTFPEGVTLNPSLAEGLSACSEADLAQLRADSPAGVGCPPASKVGTVEVQTPALPGEVLGGALYVATPYANPTHSLIAVYVVVKDPKLGILVKQPIEVRPDPKTGQIVSIAEEMPQFPLSHIGIHLREGARSPLISPPSCGSYASTAQFTPWAAPDSPYTTSSTFQINEGLGGGPCPPAGPPPFAPGFSAGSINNSAGAYSPFFMRLTRRDGDQDITRLSVKLPPGLVAKLAGVSKCSDAQIAAAKAKSGKEEQANPSCPANSQIGSVQGGAGVGSQLTYVPGKLYLAGPIGGAPLSVVGIVPAVAGPFDVGNVVVRQALKINPRTVEVEADGEASDPLPYILAGIPLKVRDIQISVDRQSFTLNPTSCAPSEPGAKLWGGGQNLFSSADDFPVSLTTRFQAADCASLGFKPKLTMRLKGPTHRGAHPAVHAVYTPRAGDANAASAVARLPRSAFLDQGHIRTICTRVQFAAKSCPPGAVYGHAKAFSPLVEEPFTGPIYLRSSNHNLPDMVLALHGLIDVEAVARIDSKNGGIRLSFEDIPDVPISKVVFDFPGGKKGLIVDSRELCVKRSFDSVQLTAHNGRHDTLRPQVKADCKKK